MSDAGHENDAEAPRKADYATSRRGLVAAAAAVFAVLTTRKARALELPPRGGYKPTKCFLRGTRIRTASGDVEVETLVAGDLVQTVDGRMQPITWVGRKVIERAPDGTWSGDVAPVRIARSALGPLVPERDLYLSPAHALYIDGILIPLRNLINGRSIAQVAVDGGTIEYFHIQLAGHDVVLAEGAPAETLLAAADLAADGWDEAMLPPPQLDGGKPVPYAPIVPAYGAVVRSRLRTAIAPLIDRRQPVDIIWERIAGRSDTELAA